MNEIDVGLIGYRRVSDRKQGESGLGLEAQAEAIARYAAQAGLPILRTYVEVETGRAADRPELLRALADCRRTRARLVIAKLDRLARNVAFTSALMDSGVDFIACDNPHANRLTLHILAAVAEDESRRISARTRDALAAYKARGGQLGAARPGAARLTPDLSARGRAEAGRRRQAAAAAAYADLAPLMAELRASGLSCQAIADRLAGDGHTTRRGKRWSGVQVARVLSRMEPEPHRARSGPPGE